MNFRILKDSIELAPETQAEVFQLEGMYTELKERNFKLKIYRQWTIQSMLLFISKDDKEKS